MRQYFKAACVYLFITAVVVLLDVILLRTLLLDTHGFLKYTAMVSIDYIPAFIMVMFAKQYLDI